MSAHGCCPNCGVPWARVIEKGESLKEWKESCGADSHGGYNGVAQKDYAAHGVQDACAVKLVSSPVWSKNAPPAGVRLANVILIG